MRHIGDPTISDVLMGIIMIPFLGVVIVVYTCASLVVSIIKTLIGRVERILTKKEEKRN